MTTADEINSLLEEVRKRAMRTDQGRAIDTLVVQALKLIEAEWNALLCEIHDAEKAARDELLVRATTRDEEARIRGAFVTWNLRDEEDWRNHA